MKKILKIIVPLLILFSGVAFLFFYDLFLEERINTVPVVIAADNIDFKDEFSKNNLRIVRMNRDFIVEDAITDINSLKDTHLLGELAAIDIKKGTQIYQALVDTNNLIPDKGKGEFIAPIPDKWIFAVPGSIRKSYIADFYVVPRKKQQSLKRLISNDQKDKGQHKPVETEMGDFQKYGRAAGLKPVLKNVRVAHTKDQSNQEVTDMEKGKKSTGVVANIEIIATQEMLHQLRQYTKHGDQLYIVYKYDR